MASKVKYIKRSICISFLRRIDKGARSVLWKNWTSEGNRGQRRKRFRWLPNCTSTYSAFSSPHFYSSLLSCFLNLPLFTFAPFSLWLRLVFFTQSQDTSLLCIPCIYVLSRLQLCLCGGTAFCAFPFWIYSQNQLDFSVGIWTVAWTKLVKSRINVRGDNHSRC